MIRVSNHHTIDKTRILAEIIRQAIIYEIWLVLKVELIHRGVQLVRNLAFYGYAIIDDTRRWMMHIDTIIEDTLKI